MKSDDFDFALWLQEFGHGATNRQATALMRALTAAVQETGKKGRLVLTINVESAGGLVGLSASIKTTVPQPSLTGGSYFVTESGALVDEDPRQLSMPKKVLDLQPIRDRNKGDIS